MLCATIVYFVQEFPVFYPMAASAGVIWGIGGYWREIVFKLHEFRQHSHRAHNQHGRRRIGHTYMGHRAGGVRLGDGTVGG